MREPTAHERNAAGPVRRRAVARRERPTPGVVRIGISGWKDTWEAAALARRHSPWLEGRTATDAGERRALRHAVEVRHPSCTAPAFIDLARRHRIAVVVADTAGRHPYLEELTADFVYVRLHGDEILYVSGYSPEAIAHWSELVNSWRSPGSGAPGDRGRDVYVYFDNDAKVRSPFDAMALERAVELAQRDRAASR